MEVAKRWSVGNWHPSGNFFILTDVAWGNGTMGAIFNGKGKLISINFNSNGNHKIVSTTKVGLSPEGFDISRDGKYAVVANMRRTYGPKKMWFVPARKNASLSLVKIDKDSGVLTTLGKEYLFEGALPEDAIFDLESNSIAVAVYQKQDEEFPKQGWIDFWELKNDQLVKTGCRIHLTRGVHNLLLIE
jgi:DNA-binding beta-propeller fold protein YncE